MYYQPSENRTFTLHAEIRAAFSNTSFPTDITDEMLASFGVYAVETTASGINPITQGANELPPALVNGKYQQRWEIYPLTPEEVATNIAKRCTELVAEINAKRDQLETEGFPYMGKQIDSDSRSVQRINTAVQAAQTAVGSGQPFAIEWTCADNSGLTLDAAGMIGMPVALAMHANAIHQHAKALKAQVQAAQTVSELESIDIHAGWPT